MSKYPLAKDGEWVQPVHRGYKFMCCDCGLVHKLNFRVIDVKTKRIVTGMKVQFEALRDNRATGQTRRKYLSIVIKKAKDARE